MSEPAGESVWQRARLPGWTLRVVVASSSAGTVGVLAGQGIAPSVVGLLVAVAVLTVAAPGSAAPLMLIGAAGALVVFVGGDPLRLGVLALIPLLHLLHVSCALAALLPRDAVLCPVVLLAPGRRFLIVQAAVFGLVGMTGLVPVGRTPPLVELAALFAAVGLAAVGVRLARRR